MVLLVCGLPQTGASQAPAAVRSDEVKLHLKSSGVDLAAILSELQRSHLTNPAPGLWVGSQAAVLLATARLRQQGIQLNDYTEPSAAPQLRLPLGSAQDRRVFEPAVAADELALRVKLIEHSCATVAHGNPANEATCRAERGYQGLATVVAKLRAADPNCTSAARAYYSVSNDCLDYGCASTSDQATFKAFDDACLNALTAWRRPDGTVHGDAPPTIFATGGANGGVEGSMRAVVLLEVIKGPVAEHVCGGLLLSGNRIATARHCFDTAWMQNKLRAGELRVRIVADGDRTYPLRWSDEAGDQDGSVVNDRIVLSFDAPKPVPAPALEFRDVDVPADAVVLGYFRDYDRTRAKDDPQAPPPAEWKRGLRWAKSGMCFVMSSQNGCVRSLCQTVPGYSGAPIVGVAPADSKAPIRVYGLISRADTGEDDRCGGRESFSTLAASTVGLQP